MKTRFRAVRVLVAILLLVGFAIVVSHSAASAQSDMTIGEVSRRIASLDGERLSERIARLEVTTNQNNTLLLSVLGTVVLLLIERVVGRVKRGGSE